jgi:hypothetical protein
VKDERFECSSTQINSRSCDLACKTSRIEREREIDREEEDEEKKE